MVHEPPNGHSTRPKSNQHLGLLSGGQNPGVTFQAEDPTLKIAKLDNNLPSVDF